MQRATLRIWRSDRQQSVLAKAHRHETIFRQLDIDGKMAMAER
jgi:hypothetical protein